MNDGSLWNKHSNYKIRRNCCICRARKKSAANPDRVCASCWRKFSPAVLNLMRLKLEFTERRKK